MIRPDASGRYHATAVAGALSAAVGVAVLTGWALDVAPLKSVTPGAVTMKPNAALAFILLGIGILASPTLGPWATAVRGAPWVSRLCAAFAAALGLITLVEYATGWNPGVDHMLFTEPPGAVATRYAGRMAPQTAASFAMLGLVTWLMAATQASRRRHIAAVALGSIVATVGVFGALSALAAGSGAAGWWRLTPMAVHTAILFVALGWTIAARAWREALGGEETLFSRHLAQTVVSVALLTALFAAYVRTEGAVRHAQDVRHRSLLLGDELRHSGDDLTRMARTYVASGDPVFKQRYQDILDIREGRKPRPADYALPYWDLIIGGDAPRRGSQEARPVLDLMRDAGFTDAEFAKLAEAKANSDALTAPELEAMRLVELGGPNAAANRARAERLLYGEQYHRAKRNVMRPILEALRMVDARTAARVRATEATAMLLRWVVALAGVVLVVTLWRAHAALRGTLGGSLDEVRARIAAIGGGTPAATSHPRGDRDDTVLAWLSAMQERLDAMESARERAHKQLLAEKQVWDSLTASMPGIMYLFDDESRFLRWNANLERISGYSTEEFARLTPLDLFRGADRDLVAERIGRAFAEGRADVEAHLVGKDGTRTPFYFTGSTTTTVDGRRCLVGVGLDMTERRSAEAALRENERRFRATFEHAAFGFTMVSPEGRFEQVNDALCRIVGYSRDELRALTFQDITHPDDLGTELALVGQVLRGEIQAYTLEKRYIRKNRSPVWVRITVSLVRDDEGQPAHFVAGIEDISVRKQAEAQVRELNATLERRVRERTAQLEEANRELEAFSYSVSHDLRAPLRAIEGFSRILAEEHGAHLGAEGRRVLGVVLAETRRMGQLVDDLLTLSRTGRQALSHADVDMEALVRSVMAEEVQRASGRVVRATIEHLPPARGDAALIRVALTNLLSNALKFTRPRSDAVITVTGHREGNQSVYTVADNGVGFDMQYAGKLFGVFQRLHTADEFEGTGVGLALAQRVIHRHGGRIWAEAQPDHGAAFHFTLPHTS